MRQDVDLGRYEEFAATAGPARVASWKEVLAELERAAEWKRAEIARMRAAIELAERRLARGRLVLLRGPSAGGAP